MKVNNLTSRNGNSVINQFEIYHNNNVFFQSYQTIIAKIDSKGQTILDNYALEYSRTTSKYLYQFLGYDRKEILKRIKDKSIILKNLNK